ncbi:MAG: hypothetical protein M1540_10045 [Candidatus Bathyarchaeota archaeon]|nr:hypothetical protein [Candidatus Bathyarchaeota archaeon]
MAKPYRLTGENSFLGLPLGFGIMGISHVIATAVAFFNDMAWFMLLFRTFSFAFIATTYFFSTKSLKKTQYLLNITLSALIVVLITLSLIAFVAPQSIWESYSIAQVYCRIFIGIFLFYIIVFTINSHVKRPDPATLWIPFGFIFLAISQYSLIFWYIDNSSAALWGAIAFRLVGLIVFLIISYRTFYSSKEAE